LTKLIYYVIIFPETSKGVHKMIQALYRRLREGMQKKETIEETRLSEVLCPIWNFPENWSKDIIEYIMMLENETLRIPQVKDANVTWENRAYVNEIEAKIAVLVGILTRSHNPWHIAAGRYCLLGNLLENYTKERRYQYDNITTNMLKVAAGKARIAYGICFIESAKLELECAIFLEKAKELIRNIGSKSLFNQIRGEPIPAVQWLNTPIQGFSYPNIITRNDICVVEVINSEERAVKIFVVWKTRNGTLRYKEIVNTKGWQYWDRAYVDTQGGSNVYIEKGQLIIRVALGERDFHYAKREYKEIPLEELGGLSVILL
jgi:hypothetical protein